MQPVRVLAMLAASALLCAEPAPIVSRLDTVSVHVDSVETYNTLLRFFSETLQWPVLYGKPLTPEDGKRRNYAGIWAGNLMVEICGPYADARFDNSVRARLHGLTFQPNRTADESITELEAAAIHHKPPFDYQGGRLRFVSVDDPDLVSPTLGLSIMEVRQSDRPKSEQKARTQLAEHGGGPLGLEAVEEVHVSAASRSKWERFLRGYSGRPSLPFFEQRPAALLKLVLRVRSASAAEAYLEEVDAERILTAGVKIVCVDQKLTRRPN